MKKQILLSLAVVGLAFSTARAQYQQTPQISVSGVAELKVAPDVISISAGVETRDVKLDAATRQNDERITSALAFLKKAGVPDQCVQMDFIQVQPDYGSGNDLIEPRFYIARKFIEIKLTTVTNLDSILTGLLNNGANNIRNVDFRTTQLRKYRDQARIMAVKAASEKADDLCKELNVKRGKPININAVDYGGFCNYSGGQWGWRANSFSSDLGDTFSIGQISVSATVNVTFGIQ